ncbi:YbaB/EbfC family nucleoid-associated protein [Streptomyces sp. NPDC097727]|uniref:YbaB/EbfC family nucleoid-associated protein n=1 Tax=Streptomyces sp. NPDC097727 TaxID=3366092 RepID=UPI003825B669
MDRPPGRRLEKVLADFAEQHGVLTRAREQIRGLSVTARSRDDVVEVTVDADGRAREVRFVDKRFRDMTAPQLGESVMEALATARAEVAARATAVTTTANFRLSTSAEPMALDGPAAPDADRDAPSVCWRRLVREARTVTAGLVPVRDPAAVKADGTVGTWGTGVQEAGPGLRDTPRSRPQGPLWGRDRPGTRSPATRTPPPVELREAVMALRDAVCDVVGGTCRPSSTCGCEGALERRGAARGPSPADTRISSSRTRDTME